MKEYGYLVTNQLVFRLAILIWIILFSMKLLKMKKYKKDIKIQMLKKEFYKLILIIYSVYIVSETLLPIDFFNMKVLEHPFACVNINILNIIPDSYYMVWYRIWSIIIFIPFPILMYLIGYKNFEKLSITIKYVFLVSLTIEVLQFVEYYLWMFKGYKVTDIVDVLLNTLGGIIGFYIFKIYKKILIKFTKKKIA